MTEQAVAATISEPVQARQGRGWFFWLLIICSIGNAAIVLNRSYNYALTYETLTQTYPDALWFIVANILTGGCVLLAVLLLIFLRRRAALHAAALLLGVSPLASAVAVLHRLPDMRDPTQLALQVIFAVLGQGYFIMAGQCGYLLTAPRVTAFYPRRDLPSRAAPELPPISGASLPVAGNPHMRPIARTWLMALFFYLLLPALWLAVPILRLASLLADHAAQTSIKAALQECLPEIIFGLASGGVLAFMILRRRWSSIVVAIAFLWLAHPIAWWYQTYGGFANILLALNPSLLWPLHLGYGIFAALAWTAYLTQSPQVRRFYPGHRRDAELVTDVDVF